MTIEKKSTLRYIVKTRLCNIENTLQQTEFTSDNEFEARVNAFEFIENYLEIIANEGLLKISSKLLNSKVVHQVNRVLSKPNLNNFTKLKLYNHETISIIPNDKIFPNGISLSFRIDNGENRGEEFEIFSYRKMSHAIIETHLNNLIVENDFLKQLNNDLSNHEISFDRNQFVTLNISKESFTILETPFLWNDESRQFQIDYFYNEDTIINGLYERLTNHEAYHYVNFIESNNIEEIEKVIYALFHADGGLIYIGYHPDSLIESVLSDQEALDYIDYLNHVFSRDEFLFKNVKLEVINYNDFPVISMIIFPLNEFSKKLQAYDKSKIFVRQNNMILKVENN
jgi:hypothetical protein